MIYFIFPSTLVLFGLLTFGTYYFLYKQIGVIPEMVYTIRLNNTDNLLNKFK